jgi:multidrug resistance efflux pump
MRGRHVAVAAAAAVAIAAAGAFFYLRNKPHEPRPAPPPKPAVSYQPGSEVTLTGIIQAQNVVLVPAPMDGVMDYVAVAVGQDVTQGQLLAQMHNDSLNQQLKSGESDLARAQDRINTLESTLASARLEASRTAADASRSRGELSKAQRANDRAQMLLSRGAGSRNAADRAREEYDTAKAEYESAQKLADVARQRVEDLRREMDTARAQFEDLQNNLELTRQGLESSEIFSPVNGVLVAGRFHQGDPVSVEVPDVFTIASDLNALEVSATVPKELGPLLRAGDPVLVFPGDAPQPVPGTLRKVQANSVIVDFQNASPVVRPGQKAQIRIKLT